MATTYTPNYNLGKQTNANDTFDMSVITDNMDKIDTAMNDNKTNISSLLPTSYTVPTVSTQYGVTVGSGGYCRIGNICLVCIRLTNTNQIPNGSNFAFSLPLPAADAGLGAGSSVVALACNKSGIYAAITNDGNIANFSGSAINANTTFVLTGAYLIKQS